MNAENFMSVLDKVEPDINLKVLIGGLALCHFDQASSKWKVFFPKAPNHNFKMIVRKRVRNTNKLIEEQTFGLFTASKIEIITDGSPGGGSEFPPDSSGIHR